jgi:hypothetical protein
MLYLLSVTAKMSDAIRSPVIGLLLHLRLAAEDTDIQSAVSMQPTGTMTE